MANNWRKHFKDTLKTSFMEELHLKPIVSHVLTNNSRTTRPTEILMPFVVSERICYKILKLRYLKKVSILLRVRTKHAQFCIEVQNRSIIGGFLLRNWESWRPFIAYGYPATEHINDPMLKIQKQKAKTDRYENAAKS